MSEIAVRIIKNWSSPDLMLQSPAGRGVWGGVRLFEGEGEADFVVVLNQPAAAISIVADREQLWAIIQEPPTPYHRHLHRGQAAFGRIYTTDASSAGKSGRYRMSQPALGWHAGLDFDTLAGMADLPPKTRDVSWITSTLSFLPEHKRRLRMIERLRACGFVEMFGRGVRPIERKWEGLAPYRYSIAYENFVGPYYWSEKIAVCFLAGAMPIYVGCSNLEDYFPAGSFVRIDPDDTDPVGTIRRIASSDLAERNRDLIVEARRRVLYEHQLFPFIAREIAAFPQGDSKPEQLFLDVRRIDNPLVYGKAVWHWKVKPRLAQLARRIVP